MREDVGTEARSEERVWRAPPESGFLATTLGLGLVMLIPGVLSFVATGLRNEGEEPFPMARRLSALVVIPLFGVAMGCWAHFIRVREIRASSEWLVIKNGLRAKRIPRAKVKGVRRSEWWVEVAFRNNFDFMRFSARRWPSDFGAELLRLYGPLKEDARFEAVVCDPEVIDRAQRASTYVAAPRSRWRAVLAMLAVVSTAAGIVAWPALYRWMVELAVPRDIERGVFGLIWVGLIALGSALLLGLIEAWRGFLSNEAHAIEVDERGVTIRRRWGIQQIAADRIRGVSFSGRSIRSPWVAVHVGPWRSVCLVEGRFAEPGVLAGVMLNRFGELISAGPRAQAIAAIETKTEGTL